nr:hypothetical protein BaRGS_023432 [Batillaria attramentaria]
MFQDVPENVNKQSLELYLEIVTGLKPTEILYGDEPGVVVVTFEGQPAVDRVLQKTHFLDKRQVKVRRYFDCLGPSGGTVDPNQLPIPNPLTLKDVSKHKRVFIQQCPEVSKSFYTHLAQVHAKPVFFDEAMTCECVVTSDVDNPRLVLKNWASEVRKAVLHFFNEIDVHRVSIPPDVWVDAEEELSGEILSSYPQASLFWSPADSVCVVVGMRAAATKLHVLVSKTVKGLKEEIERRRLKVVETYTKLKPYQLRLLEAVSFDKDMVKTYSDLTVEIDTQKEQVVFHGFSRDIRQAQSDMLRHVSTIKCAKLSRLTLTQKKALFTAESTHFIQTELRSENLIAEWEKGKSEDIFVYAFREDVLAQVTQIIEKAVYEEELSDLSPYSLRLLQSAEWMSLVRSLLENHPGALWVSPSPDGRRIYVTGREAAVHQVKDELCHFLQDLYSEIVRFAPSRQSFVSQFWKRELALLENDLKREKVKISVVNDGRDIAIEGTPEGVNLAKAKLEELEKERILCHEEKLTDKVQTKLLESRHCTKHLEDLGRQHQVVISLQREAPGLVTDVIVNSTSNDLDLTVGGVSSALLRAAGSSLQDECVSKYPEGVQLGQLARTKGHALPCKEIFHFYLEAWSPTSNKMLGTVVFSLLEKAHQKRYTSIAFPALGTGNLGYPRDEVAQTMFSVIHLFEQAMPYTSLREVSPVEARLDFQGLSLEIMKGDITEQAVDVIVVCSNGKLELNNGADNAHLSAKALFKAVTKFSTDRKHVQLLRMVTDDCIISRTYADVIKEKREKEGPGKRQNFFEAMKQKLGTPVKSPTSDDTVPDRRSPVLETRSLFIYADRRENIEAAVGGFRELAQRKVMDQITEAGHRHGVELRISPTADQITLRGDHSGIFDAMDDINHILNTAKENRQQKRAATLIANIVQWYFLEITSTGPEQREYGQRENHTLEEAFQSGQKTVKLTDTAGTAYVVDFDKMVEYPDDAPEDVVSVIRRDKITGDWSRGGVRLPAAWNPLNPDVLVDAIQLNPAAAEYRAVETNFRTTLDRDAATKFGEGVYFAVHPSYSLNETFTPRDSQGQRYIYQCKVLTGYATVGCEKMRFLPSRHGDILYDSAADDPSNPELFVIFNDTQAYPEYLITFTSRP